MIATQPEVALDGRYTHAQASRALGVHRNTLYNWVSAGLIKTYLRRDNKTKFYKGRDIITLWRTL